MFDYAKYREVRQKYFGETNREIRQGYEKYKKARSKTMNEFDFWGIPTDGHTLNIPTTATRTKVGFAPFSKECCKVEPCKKQEGKTPMRCDSNVTISAPAQKSDVQVSRDYLVDRLDSYSFEYGQMLKFRGIFNLGVDNTPQNFKDLIAAITGGKYTIDPKAQAKLDANDADGSDFFEYRGPFYGIIWDGPKADVAGYHAAEAEFHVQKKKAKGIVMTGTPADGLAAVEAFEAWMPVGPAAS